MSSHWATHASPRRTSRSNRISIQQRSPSALTGRENAALFLFKSRRNCGCSVFLAHCSTHSSPHAHTHLPPVSYGKTDCAIRQNKSLRTACGCAGRTADAHRSPGEASWSLCLVPIGTLLCIPPPLFLSSSSKKQEKLPPTQGLSGNFTPAQGTSTNAHTLFRTQT